MDFSLENVEKMKTVVCPPSPEDVSKLILTGYHDAVAFMGKEFFRTCNVLPFSCTPLVYTSKVASSNTSSLEAHAGFFQIAYEGDF